MKKITLIVINNLSLLDHSEYEDRGLSSMGGELSTPQSGAIFFYEPMKGGDKGQPLVSTLEALK